LWEEFYWAGEALRGRARGRKVSEEAVIAKIIDLVDGNEMFHVWVAGWYAFSPDYEKSQISDDALVYTMKAYRQYRENLPNLGLGPEMQAIAEDLLVEQLQWVVNQWSIVPVERTPPILKERLVWAQRELCLVNICKKIGPGFDLAAEIPPLMIDTLEIPETARLMEAARDKGLERELEHYFRTSTTTKVVIG
jgi:hypothetical protein